MITVAELARYRFDYDYEGAFYGMFPACPRIAPREFGDVEVDAAPYIQAELIA
jgi:hypothetical protein